MSRRPVKHVLCYRGKRKCVSPMKVLVSTPPHPPPPGHQGQCARGRDPGLNLEVQYAVTPGEEEGGRALAGFHCLRQVLGERKPTYPPKWGQGHGSPPRANFRTDMYKCENSPSPSWRQSDTMGPNRQYSSSDDAKPVQKLLPFLS